MKNGATQKAQASQKRKQALAPQTAARLRQRWLRARIVLLGVIILGGGVAVAQRAYELQVVQAPELRELAEQQYLRNIRLSPKRGTIYDRHGAELAVSVDGDSIWANPRALRASGGDPQTAAARLSALLDLNHERIERRLQSNRYFVWIKRRVTPRQAAAVRELEIPGVRIEREARRYYPNRELAAHVLGFSNVDGVGIEGLELSLEEHLRGSAQTVPAIRDRRGAVVFSRTLLDDRATQGDDITLTLDKTIQRVAERELELAVRTFEARAGNAVVMDPRTGEILAMANYPTFNPNEPGRFPASHRRNRTVTDRYEPGSTIKPFTVAAALARGTVGANQLIDCEGGSIEVDGFTINDSHPHDELTPAQILAFSSNIGTSKIGYTLGRRGVYTALRRFGFGQQTGVDMPGEAEGVLRHHRRWYAMDAATIPFGQGMSVTTLQLAASMSVIANGGRLMRPILIRRVSDVEGAVVDENLPTVRRQVVPAATARLVADMLTAVTGPGGTGPQAAIEGYLVAGKTGTAQKADYVRGGYADDRWLASFVGFVPADRPRLVIAVSIDEPIIEHYGGVVAGPVFRRIGAAALRHLGVPRSGVGNPLARVMRDRRRAAREAAEADAAQLAEAVGDESEAAEEVEISEPESAIETAPAVPGEGQVLLPDLSGQSARQAVRASAELGLLPHISGTGFVIAQTPEAGVPVDVGSELRLVLAAPAAAVEYAEPEEENLPVQEEPAQQGTP